MKRVLFTIVLFLCTIGVAQAKMVSIAGEVVNMRSGPGENYAVLWELGVGYPLKVVSGQGEWLKVVDFENDTGWVQKSLVNEVPHLVVKKKLINIRSGPGRDHDVIRQAQAGVVFRTLERDGDWVKVEHQEENIVGWVKRTLLWGW